MSNELMLRTNPMPAFDVEALRADFPILSREVHGKPLAYLDNGASAQKPRAVIDIMRRTMENEYANVHRGLHYLSNATTNAFEEARDSVRRFVNAQSSDEIIFTKGGTEAINLVAASLGAGIETGDEIILSEMEHHSNIVPWHFLRERNGAVLKWVPLTDEDTFDLTAYGRLLSSKTRIVSVTQMSNVLGTRTPIAEIAHMAHSVGAKVLVDGCQGAVHGPVDVQDLDCDFYVATGHKLYGPSGIGFLYGKLEYLKHMRPYQGGGEMIGTVTKEAITYAAPPHRFEAGTPPIVEAIGLGTALDYLGALDQTAVAEHETALLAHAMEELARLDGVRLFGHAPDKGPIVTFDIDGAHPHDVSTVLDRFGIAVRAGTHCAQPLMDRLGIPASTRASFALYNTHEEVERLVQGIAKVLEFFR